MQGALAQLWSRTIRLKNRSTEGTHAFHKSTDLLLTHPLSLGKLVPAMSWRCWSMQACYVCTHNRAPIKDEPCYARVNMQCRAAMLGLTFHGCISQGMLHPQNLLSRGQAAAQKLSGLLPFSQLVQNACQLRLRIRGWAAAPGQLLLPAPAQGGRRR